MKLRPLHDRVGGPPRRCRETTGISLPEGIIDPTEVVRTALQDAASIAGLLITTEAMVAEKLTRPFRHPWITNPTCHSTRAARCAARPLIKEA